MGPHSSSSGPKFALRRALVTSLDKIGRITGVPLVLGPQDSCTVMIGPYPSPITVQWVESARAVAVYAPFPVPVPPCTPEALALNLARIHTLGASTLGCQFWLGPKDQPLVGVVLLGPALSEDELLEAIGRVARLTEKLATGRAPSDLGKAHGARAK